jgi:predicted transposase YdaD
MGKLDITLRDIISNIPHKFVEILTGKRAVKILDNTFPSVKERKADLILEMEDGSIFHLELQTNNDKDMPFRMAEYLLLIAKKYNTKNVNQMVLYVGDGKPNMETDLRVGRMTYDYELRDIKEIECKELLDSDSIEDKILAVLCRVENFEKYVD